MNEKTNEERLALIKLEEYFNVVEQTQSTLELLSASDLTDEIHQNIFCLLSNSLFEVIEKYKPIYKAALHVTTE